MYYRSNKDDQYELSDEDAEAAPNSRRRVSYAMESGEESDGFPDDDDADEVVSGDGNSVDSETGTDRGAGESVDGDGLDWETGDDPVAGESMYGDSFDWETGDDLVEDERADDGMDIVESLEDYPSVNKDGTDANRGSGADNGGNGTRRSITSNGEQPIVSRMNLKRFVLLTCTSSLKPMLNLSQQL